MQRAAVALVVFFALVAGAAKPPAVRIAADAPVAVAGSGFRDHESVRVTIVMGTRRFERAAVASAEGEFSVRFSGTRLDRCATPLVVSAEGQSTGLVSAVLPPRECMAP